MPRRAGARPTPTALSLLMGLLVSLGTAGVTTAPSASASAPFPPLDACLGSGSFVLQDDACSTRRPARGDQFGPITSVQQVTVPPGSSVRLRFAGSVDFDTPTGPCGDLGCPYASIQWRAQGIGADVAFLDGCGPRDLGCTVSVAPAVGDAGEDVIAVFAQEYAGIHPVAGTAFALYAPPQLYPIRVSPIDSRGRALPVSLGDVAFAVRDGAAGALQADCVAPDWWTAANRQARPTAPDCVTLAADGSGTAGAFTGVLPNGERWTITTIPAGELLEPIGARPTPYKRLGVSVADDDIWTTVVYQERPTIEVALVPEAATMDLGATQTVRLTVRATGGEAGSLDRITFSVPDVLEAIAAPDAALVVGAPTSPVPDPLTLGPGAEQVIELPVTAAGLGTTRLRVTATAIDDVGATSVDGLSVPITVAIGDAVAGDGPPPVITRAHDVTAGFDDRIEGTVTGTPGGRVTVSLAMAPTAPDGSCAGAMSGPATEALGSLAVDVGPDGTGTFAVTRRLSPGNLVYGIAVADGIASPVSACVPVSVESPTISIADAELEEQPSKGQAGSVDVAVSLSAPSESAVSITVSSADGTATAPADYVAIPSTTLTIPPGAMTATITVTAAVDTATEPDEDLTLTLSDPVGGTLDPEASTATVFILDEPAAAAGFTMRGRWRIEVREKGRWLDNEAPLIITRYDPGSGRFSGTERFASGSVFLFTGDVSGDTLKATVKIKGVRSEPGYHTCTLDRAADPVTASCDYVSGTLKPMRAKLRWIQESAEP